jgi:hypothetical protein
MQGGTILQIESVESMKPIGENYVDPKSDHATRDDEQLIQTSEQASNSSRSILGDVERRHHRSSTNTAGICVVSIESVVMARASNSQAVDEASDI